MLINLKKFRRFNYQLFDVFSMNNSSNININDIRSINDEMESILGKFDFMSSECYPKLINQKCTIDSKLDLNCHIDKTYANSTSTYNDIRSLNDEIQGVLGKFDKSFNDNSKLIHKRITNDTKLDLNYPKANEHSTLMAQKEIVISSNRKIIFFSLDINLENLASVNSEIVCEKLLTRNEKIDNDMILNTLSKYNDCQSIIIDFRCLSQPISKSTISLINLCSRNLRVAVILEDAKLLPNDFSKEVLVLAGLTKANINILALVAAIL